MRVRAWLALVVLGLAGCAHLPDKVKVDLDGRVIEVGSCRCALPGPAAPPPAPAPVVEGDPAVAPVPAGPSPGPSQGPANPQAGDVIRFGQPNQMVHTI